MMRLVLALAVLAALALGQVYLIEGVVGGVFVDVCSGGGRVYAVEVFYDLPSPKSLVHVKGDVSGVIEVEGGIAACAASESGLLLLTGGGAYLFDKSLRYLGFVSLNGSLWYGKSVVVGDGVVALLVGRGERNYVEIRRLDDFSLVSQREVGRFYEYVNCGGGFALMRDDAVTIITIDGSEIVSTNRLLRFYSFVCLGDSIYMYWNGRIIKMSREGSASLELQGNFPSVYTDGRYIYVKIVAEPDPQANTPALSYLYVLDSDLRILWVAAYFGKVVEFLQKPGGNKTLVVARDVSGSSVFIDELDIGGGPPGSLTFCYFGINPAGRITVYVNFESFPGRFGCVSIPAATPARYFFEVYRVDFPSVPSPWRDVVSVEAGRHAVLIVTDGLFESVVVFLFLVLAVYVWERLRSPRYYS